MTKTELQLKKDMLEKELSKLNSIKLSCHNCESFAWPRGYCQRYQSEVPKDVQSAGCDSWVYDEIPF